MKIIREIKEFAVRGNVVDMAVGIAIGASFTAVVNSVVKDIFNPIVVALTAEAHFRDFFLVLRSGKTGEYYRTLSDAQADGAVTMNLGIFLDVSISFLIVAIFLYFLVKASNRLRRPEEPKTDPVKTRECPECKQVISLSAKRCPFCTSWIREEEPTPQDAAGSSS